MDRTEIELIEQIWKEYLRAETEEDKKKMEIYINKMIKKVKKSEKGG